MKYLRSLDRKILDKIRSRCKIALKDKTEPEKSEFDFEKIRKRITARAGISKEK